MIEIFNKAKIIKLNPYKTYPAKNLTTSIEGFVQDILKRAEYEVSDEHYYKKINAAFNDNNLNCKGIAFTISQDSDKFNGHLLEVSMLHPSMKIEISRPLAYGNKKEILNFLKDKSSVKTIKEDLETMVKELHN